MDNSQELYHYGVKGMKWGVRKKNDKISQTKAAYKTANKEFDQAYRQANSKRHQAYSLSKKKRAANDARWEEVGRKAENLEKAQQAYKNAKSEFKLEKKYKAVGRKMGMADYQRDKGNAEYKKHDDMANVLDKSARKWERDGNYFKAELARKSAASLRARGENRRAAQYELADYYVQRGNKLTQKANTFATKKNVSLGKSKVDSILKEGRQEGRNLAKANDEFDREMRVQDTFGDAGVDVYNRARGKN